MHYLVHKVSRVDIKNDILCFTFVKDDGQE